jgi:hypothetical protein
LEKLGFPWILSSELSIFNGLRWIFAESKFARPFAAAPELRERRPTILVMLSGRIAHRASVTLFLIFCKKLLALIALSVDRPASAVMAGLVPAIHAARLRHRSLAQIIYL